MKKDKLSTLIKVCLVFISCFAFITACQKEDVVDTNQMGSGEVTLKSFGPSPIQRGNARLIIIGTNLNKVESVALQGAGEITDFKRVSNTEIWLESIPANALPGVITLTAGSKKITSITPLTFSEPILITSITPLTVKAGDKIKIEGDYLNLIKEIIFTDGVHVDTTAFLSQNRKAIEVLVPVKARSGKVIVSNGADLLTPADIEAKKEPGIPIWVYSEQELIVTLPAITKISPNPIKAGSLLTIEGTNFDLVDSLAFVGNVGTRNFASKTATKITVTVPATAADGKIKAFAFSGIPVLSDSLILTVPTITAISPNPVKNGAVLTITGTDLDLVSSVTFGGGKVGTIVAGGTATQIQVNVPIDATNGAVTLTTKANKSVLTPVLSMVLPTITNISPTTIIAGDSVTITGTDLDLVNAITFGGPTTGVIRTQTATQIIVRSTTASITGPVVLTIQNGAKVTSTQIITVNPATTPVITSITPTSVKPGAMISIVGLKLNNVQDVVFETGLSATQYGSRTPTLLEVYVPLTAKRGPVTLTLKTFDGQQVSGQIIVTGTDPVVDPTLILYDFDNISADLWNGVGEFVTNDGPSGKYYEVTAAKPSTGTWQFLFAENWRTHPTVSGIANYVLKIDVRLRKDLATPAGSWGLQLQFNLAGKVFNIESYLKVGNVLSTDGEWKTISIPLSSISGLSDPTPATGGNWGINSNQGSPFNDLVGLCIDNIRYEKVK